MPIDQYTNPADHFLALLDPNPSEARTADPETGHLDVPFILSEYRGSKTLAGVLAEQDDVKADDEQLARSRANWYEGGGGGGLVG